MKVLAFLIVLSFFLTTNIFVIVKKNDLKSDKSTSGRMFYCAMQLMRIVSVTLFIVVIYMYISLR